MLGIARQLGLRVDLLGKIVIIAVLSSAAASTQTTILPTSRTALSMARSKAFPRRFAHIHQEHQTPDTATWWMGALSIIWYVGLTLVSEDILFDSIAALGLMIAFYYGMTGFACVWYFRRDLTKSARNFWLVGVAPLVGGLMLGGDLRQVLLRPGQGGRGVDDVLRPRAPRSSSASGSCCSGRC